jgi:leader peptidase (prepilin peptidase)/N-methyltransferase
MLLAVWIAFLLVTVFLLGSAVGSFLNVCIIRLPQGQSLIRPGSHCGHCHKPIRLRDNLPLVSYWLLRGRCRMCGAPFSSRYFWVELLTGLAFVLIFHLEIGWNVHHLPSWMWYDSGYEYVLVGRMPPQPWVFFAVHALLCCFLIVITLIAHEHRAVPRSIVRFGLVAGLFAAVLCPWPWPEPAEAAIQSPSPGLGAFLPWQKPYEGGPRVGAMPADKPWSRSDVTPLAGLYSWPGWGPLPSGLPPGYWQLGLATGLAGVLAGASLTGLVRLLFNLGVGSAALGGSEVGLLAIAGAFLGWQPVVVAGLLALLPGLASAIRQWTVRKRSHVSYCLWLVLALAPVCLSWYWIGPLVQGLFFDGPRLLLFAIGCAAMLVALAACLRLAGAAHRGDRTEQEPERLPNQGGSESS